MRSSPFTTAVKFVKTDALETSPSFFLTISPLAEKKYYFKIQLYYKTIYYLLHNFY